MIACTVLHSHRSAVWDRSSSSASSPMLGVVGLFNFLMGVWWYLPVVLVPISLTSSDVCVYHLHIYLNEVSVQVFYPILILGCLCLSFENSFRILGTSFIRYMFCKYLLWVYGLTFRSLAVSFEEQKILTSMKSSWSVWFFCDSCCGVMSKK